MQVVSRHKNDVLQFSLRNIWLRRTNIAHVTRTRKKSDTFWIHIFFHFKLKRCFKLHPVVLGLVRCVRQERISIRGSVRPSVGPWRLCKKHVSGLYLATVRSYTETIEPTCFESLLHNNLVSSICSSICLSLNVTWSIHAETQSGRIFARSGLFTLSFIILLLEIM